MSNSYNYIDPDYTYTNPTTGVLRNLLHIDDPDTLLFVESGAVIKRLKELYERPIPIVNVDSLFEIHKQLFQDIYDWAGKKRNVEISKNGKQFFPLSHFDAAFRYINQLIADYYKIPKNNKKELSEQLSYILDHVNYLHPFREGNGRTQREFLRLLALEKGWILNLNPPDQSEVYEKYMNGTIHGDLKVLTDLIYDLMVEDK